ncbi:estradiol 17-beta-dehydrogenase 11-like [Chironomus tepperi]|uniref:estradiol 17-beta-dehydrogenase 11-like n=1 Tax=Chironomus tepperi TaxID=113505 RepID=UPI00391EE2C3
MFNINDINHQQYTAAGANTKTLSALIWKFTYWFFVGATMSIIETVTFIYHLFIPRTPVDVSKQLALVTGGGNGMGRAFCFRLAKEKCDIAVVDIDYQSALRTATEIQEQFNVKCKAFQCDISDHAAVLELKNKVESEMRPIDILVNNAGLLYMSDFLTSNMKDIKRVVDVNVTSQISVVHTFLPGMNERKRGRILTVASITVLNPMPAAVVYTGTKFAVEGFMSCLNDELSVHNRDDYIKLTTLYPDFTHTRKELSDTLDLIKYDFPRLTPERVADEGIHGLLTNQKRVLVSDIKIAHYFLRLFPDSARKYLMQSMTEIGQLLK